MTILEQRAYEAIAKMAHKDEPDYWEQLKHQYAGMAMQTILEKSHNEDYHTNLMTSWSKCGAEEVARLSVIYATALVEVLKKSDV